MTSAYRQHLSSYAELVTPHEATRAGFVDLALEKNRMSTPTVAEARALRTLASAAQSARDLMYMPQLEQSLLAAAGVSDKAIQYLTPEDKLQSIDGLISNFLEPAGAQFVEELVYRFLITRGDALGGRMRNLVGALAKKRFTRATIAALSVLGKKFEYQHSSKNVWIAGTALDPSIEEYVRALKWEAADGSRVLIYGKTVALVKKNIDVVVLACQPDDVDRALTIPAAYKALGELKGGIDPAGADEHWKTADTALARIRSGFSAAHAFPMTFFVGAAVVNSMAAEIWQQLQSGQLSNAANLTNPEQLAALCSWLVSL